MQWFLQQLTHEFLMSVPCNISTFLNISPYRLYDCLYTKKPLNIFQETCLLFVTFIWHQYMELNVQQALEKNIENH